MYPDPRQYLAHFPTFVLLYAGAAFDSGSVKAVGGNEGFAMWLPPGTHSDMTVSLSCCGQAWPPARLAEIFDLVSR